MTQPSALANTPTPAPVPRTLAITERAARRIAALTVDERAKGQDPLFRVHIDGGGCSGFQYGFVLDTAVNGDDTVFNRDGVRVVVDASSLDLLAGSELDWVETLAGASFQITNPNAASSCGCGSSFAV
ncbi:MAG: iron-sulfur cluster insertion protein ErpA [Alphaproteobacteria bacterium]|nr:iron-sulfur cluster insertion protein ErpA [Alphaproteobacteria bacterium]